VNRALIFLFLCLALFALSACAGAMEANEYAYERGMCADVCRAMRALTLQPTSPPTVDMSEFIASGNAQAAAHGRPKPLERKVDLSNSQLVGESYVHVIQDLGMPMGIVKDGNSTCDAYMYDPGVKACIGGGSCSISQKLARAMTPPVFTTIYSYAAPRGASCSATTCEKHLVLICYGPDGNLKDVREFNSA
jgi:hypothetical protein